MAIDGPALGEYVEAYRDAPKKTKGRILDEVVAETGWSRDNARRRLRREVGPTTALARAPGPHSQHPRLALLCHVWRVSGGQCGKHLAASLPLLLDALQRHRELPRDAASLSIREELLGLSAATLDRALTAVRDSVPRRLLCPPADPRLLDRRHRRADPEAFAGLDGEPGVVRVSLFHAPGRGTRTPFAFPFVRLTDAHTGWVTHQEIDEVTPSHIAATVVQASRRLPFAVTALSFCSDDRAAVSELRSWARDARVSLLDLEPGPPPRALEPPGTEPHHRCRHGGSVVRRLLAGLEARFNVFTPVRRREGGTFAAASDGVTGDRATGRRYDPPATPLDRLLAARVLSPDQERQLRAYLVATNPALLSRQIELAVRVLDGIDDPTPDIAR